MFSLSSLFPFFRNLYDLTMNRMDPKKLDFRRGELKQLMLIDDKVPPYLHLVGMKRVVIKKKVIRDDELLTHRCRIDILCVVALLGHRGI
jgi:hypothetical protein